MVFDLTLDRVQNTRFRNTFNVLIKQVVKETNFIESEINAYLLIYYKFSLNNALSKDKKIYQGMTKAQLRSFLLLYFDINDNFILQHITRVVSQNDVGGIISSAKSWIELLTIYASESLDDHIQFCFKVYDIFSEGHLNRYIISIFIDNYFLGDDDDNEYTTDMLSVLMERFDIDKDGVISFDDYRKTVHETPDLLQFLGICIPTRSAMEKIFSKEFFLNKLKRVRHRGRKLRK